MESKGKLPHKPNCLKNWNTNSLNLENEDDVLYFTLFIKVVKDLPHVSWETQLVRLVQVLCHRFDHDLKEKPDIGEGHFSGGITGHCPLQGQLLMD